MAKNFKSYSLFGFQLAGSFHCGLHFKYGEFIQHNTMLFIAANIF